MPGHQNREIIRRRLQQVCPSPKIDENVDGLIPKNWDSDLSSWSAHVLTQDTETPCMNISIFFLCLFVAHISHKESIKQIGK